MASSTNWQALKGNFIDYVLSHQYHVMKVNTRHLKTQALMAAGSLIIILGDVAVFSG